MGVSRDSPNFFAYSCIISGTGKATGFKFGGYIYRANPNKRPLKFWGNGSVGVSRDCPNFLDTPMLSQERVKLRTSNLAGTFTGPIRKKTIINFEEKIAWAYPRTAQIFWVPPIISGTGKATDFKFCRNIHRVDWNERP